MRRSSPSRGLVLCFASRTSISAASPLSSVACAISSADEAQPVHEMLPDRASEKALSLGARPLKCGYEPYKVTWPTN